MLDEFGDAVIDHIKNDSPADVVHANYWLSGLVGHRIKHELDCRSSPRSTRSPR